MKAASILCTNTPTLKCSVHSGSHKTGAALPEGWRDMEDGVHPMITREPAVRRAQKPPLLLAFSVSSV